MTPPRPEEPRPGARWVRAALQVNPYTYEGKMPPAASFPDEHTYNDAIIAACHSENIRLIAVTDHWAIQSASNLISAADSVDIVALPGFEANTAEGIHLLVIFESGTSVTDVNAAIGACGVTPGCPNGTPGESFKNILKAMDERGALVVPAHANVSPRGIMTANPGVPLQRMITNPGLHAIAITPSAPPAQDQTIILAGTPPYKRTHPLATIYADDISNPNKLSTEGSATWFRSAPDALKA